MKLLLLATAILWTHISLGQTDTCSIIAPNAISIAEEGSSESFGVVCSCSLQSYDLNVYDRWGTLQFHSKDMSNTWINSEIEQATYVWMLSYTLKGSSEEKFEKGSFTAIR